MREVSVSYLDELNDVQREAVTHMHGPVMVVAGPGSGKTRVLTYRISYLINKGIPPWQILALTFTNKAAREMKERIEHSIGSSAYKIWAGTFHSIFARILRVEASKIGFPNDFTIYDSDDSKSVVNEIIKSLNLDKKIYNAASIRNRISHAKSNLITPKRYVEDSDIQAYDKSVRRPFTYQIYKKYVEKCERAGAMDFDDLLLQIFKLLHKNPDGVREKYQRQFRFLMVDEFQDTNFLQYEILKLFIKYDGSEENLCVVGDDAQSIYSFRGATIENILQFETDFPNTKIFKLEQNYRSTNHIVEAANGIIEYNVRQIQKKIWTQRVSDHKIKIIKATSDSEEGKRIADLILEQKHRHNLSNQEFAILYRTNAQSRVFEEHLRRRNIHYRIYGGLSFYQRKEIKDLLAYMRLTVNPKDDEAFKRIINYPRRGIGNTTLNKLIQFSNDNELSLWEAIPNISLSRTASSRLAEFAYMVAKFKKRIESGSNAYEIAQYVSRKTGILDSLKQDNSLEGLGRVENINSLLDGIKEFVEDDEIIDGVDNFDKSLSAYLQNIALITDFDQDTDSKDVVTLMSVHAAKGLEYESVFVVGLEENLFPSYMALSTPDAVDEERRLFYVAITRAKNFLTLSYANSRYHYGQIRFNDPSRFLDELPPDTLDSVMIVNKKKTFAEPKKLGGLQPMKRHVKNVILNIDPKDFTPSDPAELKIRMRILHLKFGEGTILKIDDRNIATIRFDKVFDSPEKRIMLKHAKLQILQQ